MKRSLGLLVILIGLLLVLAAPVEAQDSTRTGAGRAAT